MTSFPNDRVSVENQGIDPLITNVEEMKQYTEEEPRQCRICLDDDEEDGSDVLIAPCSCKGHQRWVHRKCLDDWRANNQNHIAFSKCTECLTEYQMVYVGPSAGKQQYYFYVTRDVAIGFTMMQSLMLLLGALVWLCFAQGESEYKTIAGITIKNTWPQLLLADLVIGLLVSLVLLGIYGALVLCISECSLDRAMNEIEALAETFVGTSSSSQPIIQPRPLVNSPMNRVQNFDIENVPHRSTMDRGNRRYDRRGPDVYFCPNCDCGTQSTCHCHPGICNGDCCNCSCPSGGSGDCKADHPILLIVLLVIGAVLAAIGLVVGVFLSCFLLRAIMKRHLFRLKKKKLAKNYVVQDLSSGLDPSVQTELPPEVEAHPIGDAGIPAKGCLIGNGRCGSNPHEDYLRKLGLMDTSTRP